MLEKRLARYNLITISFAVLEFALVLCAPLVNLDGSTAQKIGAYVLAAAFWSCMIVEFIFVRLATGERKWIERRKYRNRVLQYSQSGVISFFKNPEATVVDVVLFILAAVVVIIARTQVKTGWIILVSISALFLSFNLHCILNGKNYRYLKAFRLYTKEHERDE